MGDAPCLTTGSCAAAAAMAAARVWLGESVGDVLEVALPGGATALAEIHSSGRDDDSAWATVVKPANADADVTAGVEITVRLRKCEGEGVSFKAGNGVGTVTRSGLALPPGEAAINPVPRAMIAEALSRLGGGWEAEVSAAGGREIAEKTYNPRLGIEGGISILGTAGLVRPFCRRAQIDAFACSLSVALAAGHRAMMLVPGHIGAAAAEKRFRFRPEQLLEVGNAWGDALKLVGSSGLERVLLAGHPGKLAKLADGAEDTHSARSESAVPSLLRLAEKGGLRLPPESSTVEGLFKAMPRDERRALASLAARAVAEAVAARTGKTAAAWLCDLSGAELGYAGDLSPWL